MLVMICEVLLYTSSRIIFRNMENVFSIHSFEYLRIWNPWPSKERHDFNMWVIPCQELGYLFLEFIQEHCTSSFFNMLQYGKCIQCSFVEYLRIWNPLLSKERQAFHIWAFLYEELDIFFLIVSKNIARK